MTVKFKFIELIIAQTQQIINYPAPIPPKHEKSNRWGTGWGALFAHSASFFQRNSGADLIQMLFSYRPGFLLCALSAHGFIDQVPIDRSCQTKATGYGENLSCGVIGSIAGGRYWQLDNAVIPSMPFNDKFMIRASGCSLFKTAGSSFPYSQICTS